MGGLIQKASVLGRATLYVVAFVGLLQAAVPGADAFTAFVDKLAHVGISRDVAFAIVMIPVALAAIDLAFAWYRRRARKDLEARGATATSAFQPGYFRLRPFGGSGADRDVYARRARPDGLERHLEEWLSERREPVLYLTGDSGTGKSSLLAAAVLPALSAREDSPRVIETRIYTDPVGDLTKAVLEPGRVWDVPPADLAEPRAVLEAAVAHLGGRRLLVVIDQSEELLVLHDEARRAPFEALLRSLTASPLAGLTLLLVFRDDYLPQIEGADYLPRLRMQENWRQVGAFSPAMAEAFLNQAHLDLGSDLTQALLDEAAEVEERRDLIRPIVLNMLGLALERSVAPRRRYFKAKGDTGQLLRRHLETELGSEDLPRQLLAEMITRQGTKAPRTVAEVTAAVRGGSEALVRGTLRRLEGAGIVRLLDEATDTWEVSHDFVARLLAQSLSGWRAALWPKLRSWILPILCFAIVAAVWVPESREATIERLNDALGKHNISSERLPNQHRHLKVRDGAEIAPAEFPWPVIEKLATVVTIERLTLGTQPIADVQPLIKWSTELALHWRPGGLAPKDAQALLANSNLLLGDVATRAALTGALAAFAGGDPRFAGRELGRIRIPGGKFLMGAQSRDSGQPGYDEDAGGGEAPPHEVEVAAFQLGATEVTVAQYLKFVEDGGYGKESLWQEPGAWAWKNDPGRIEPGNWQDQLANPLNRPVVNVTWYEASAYARWVGGRLPTEAEWEFAARGAEGRRYPWGKESPDENRAIFGDVLGTAGPVGMFPRGATPEGVHDLAGNVWEWVADAYRGYPVSQDSESGDTDPDSRRVLRGGSFNGSANFLRAAYRSNSHPSSEDVFIGFRVAWSLPGGQN